MAKIELHERFFGEGLIGRIDLPTGSNFDDLRRAFVDAAEMTAREAGGLRADLASLGWSLDSIAGAVRGLERQSSARLGAQTRYLAEQVQALASIDTALRTPAKIHAAERMGDAAGLLRSRRYERALRCAEEAMEGDPNHPGGFVAAGWALIGLGRVPEAAVTFSEAHDAVVDPDSKAEYARLAARCLLVSDRSDEAIRLMESVRSAAISDPVAGALHYDLTLAYGEAGDHLSATSAIDVAVRCDPRYAQLAVAEPLLRGHREVVRRALAVAKEIEAREAAERERLDDEARKAAEAAIAVSEMIRNEALQAADDRLAQMDELYQELQALQARARERSKKRRLFRR